MGCSGRVEYRLVCWVGFSLEMNLVSARIDYTLQMILN